MNAVNTIAIYNATSKELVEADGNLQVQNYWRQLDGDERVYTLEDYAWVDLHELAGYEHDDFIEAGWTVLQ
jgi:hypothetical protein